VTILETKRLVLRHLLPGDLDGLYALYRDPEIRRFFLRYLDLRRDQRGTRVVF